MRKSATFCLCLAMALSAGQVLAQTTYRWIHPKTGETMITDTPPPGSAEILDRKSAATPDPLAGYSVAARRAAQNFPVTLYTSAECKSECDDARKLLNKRGVPFSERKVASEKDVQELKSLTGSANVPTLKVGRQNMKGFLAEQYDQMLDLAGYPRTAPYGLKPKGSAGQ